MARVGVLGIGWQRALCVLCMLQGIIMAREPRLGAGPLYKYALIMSSAKSAANLRTEGQGEKGKGRRRQ